MYIPRSNAGLFKLSLFFTSNIDTTSAWDNPSINALGKQSHRKTEENVAGKTHTALS